jgi:hypothetical protein
LVFADLAILFLKVPDEIFWVSQAPNAGVSTINSNRFTLAPNHVVHS